jgi:LmbE family N-acetylglucosaminyl deacetylase
VSAELQLDANSRVMFLAPHPDDDTLGAAGLLRRTVARGGAVRILFATCGENNPWTQRVVERRFRIGAADRTRFGARRRAEALAALARLGVDAMHAEFLEFPDQGITGLLKAGGAEPVARLARSMAAWRPGILVTPALNDVHPDHNALAILAALAIDQLEPGSRPATVLQYVIHSVDGGRESADDVRLSLTTEEQETKRAAIRCHATQLAVHPSKFMSFAGPKEAFARPRADSRSDAVARLTAPPTGAAGDALFTLEARPRSRPGSFGPPRLALLAVAAGGERVACTIAIPRRSERVEVRRMGDGALLGTGTVTRNGRALTLSVSKSALPPAARLFSKIERPFGFFDEAGWTEIEVAPRRFETSPRQEIRAADRAAVACIVPCYNVAAFCADVVRGAADFSNHVLAIDDGSTDATRRRLGEVESASGGRVRLLSFASNRGKGVALIEGIRKALLDPHVAVILTLDGDGQHRPADVPRLLAAWREGADLVIGARGFSGNTPPRSRIGNTLIRGFLRLFYPACPADTQSGFRALDRSFAELVVRRVAGARYETETHMLLLAMDEGHPIATVSIPTIYSDGNRSSHFRPLRDSARIGLSVLRWKMSGPESRHASEGEPSATTPST